MSRSGLYEDRPLVKTISAVFQMVELVEGKNYEVVSSDFQEAFKRDVGGHSGTNANTLRRTCINRRALVNPETRLVTVANFCNKLPTFRTDLEALNALGKMGRIC